MAFDPDEYLTPPAPAAAAAAVATTGFDPDAYSRGAAPAAAPPPPIYRGAILPFSRDKDGVSFDPLGSGPIGALRQAFTLPGRVASGEVKVDPSNPNFVGETVNFAGSFGPSVNPMVRSGDRAIPGAAMAPKDPALAVTPSSAELLKRGGEQLDAFRDLPLKYDPRSFGNLAIQTEQDLLKHGVLRENSPQLYAFVDALKKNSAPTGATVHAEPANLMAMRENLAGLFGKQHEHQKGVGVAFEKLNDFIEKPPAGAVLAGSPSFLAAYGPELYARGRGNYAAGMRAGGLEDVKRTADFRAAAANSGANTDNSLRSRIASVVLDAKKMRGFNAAEEAALEAVPLGDTKRNVMRYAGNLLGGGGGLGSVASSSAAGSAAAYLGLPPSLATGIGAATPALGAYLKRAAGKGTAEALDEAIDMTKRRSPLFMDMGRQDLVPDVVRGRDAMARALMQLQATGFSGLPTRKPVLEYDPNRA
jgi:hypothetical protein